LNQQFDVLGIGLNATDTVVLLDQFPPYAGKVAYREEFLSPGGQVATAVVACAKLGLSAKYIGTIGDDLRGQIQQASLRETGVDVSGLIVRQGCPNQTAYILIDPRTGERTVLWHRADSLRLRREEVREEEIGQCRLLHIDGYDIEAAERAGFLARRHQIPVSLDVDTVYPGFESVLRVVDFLVAGSGWPTKWTGEDDPLEALARLQQEYGMRVAAMTLGHYGAVALESGRWYYSAGFEIPCVDTTGAGDVFHGAFCYALIRNLNRMEALTFANAAAALNCTALGARGHLPDVGEVRALLREAETGRRSRLVDLEIEEAATARNSSGAEIGL